MCRPDICTFFISNTLQSINHSWEFSFEAAAAAAASDVSHVTLTAVKSC